MTKAVTLLACACALPAAAAVAVTPSLADTETTEAETNTEATEASEPTARAASERLQARYRRWRRKLERHGVWRGRNLVRAAAANDRPPTARTLRRSIRRMSRRFKNWSTTYEGRATIHRLQVRRIPDWGRSQLSSIARCESRNNPRAIGGGGAYRGLYQFSLGTWRAVGGAGDPAAAPRSEQTWRAWLLLKTDGSAHWPACG